MARIRTIKPEFFTSADIVDLSVIARLLYIALWCEADREGRLEWKPKTFKLRYLAGDSVDIEKLCQELLNAGLVVLYGEQKEFGYIPKFAIHQHINPRESVSRLPEPSTNDASSTRQPRDSDAQVGKEGKGKERKGKEDADESRQQKGFVKPTVEEVHAYMIERNWKCPDGQGFIDYWDSMGWKRGRNSMKDWQATVRTSEGFDWFKGKTSPQEKREPILGVDYLIDEKTGKRIPVSEVQDED